MLALTLSVLTSWATVAPAQTAPARNPFDVFRVVATAPIELAEHGPTREHPVATECGITDRACVVRHDDNVLNLALMTGRRVICEFSTAVKTCMDIVDLINGDMVPTVDPMLSDPCTYVTRVDGKGALLYNRKLMRSRWTWNQGWKAASFIGVCDVRTMTGPKSATELPQFPWVSR